MKRQILGGVVAAISIIGSLLGQDDESIGEEIDLSVLESMLVLNETGAIAPLLRDACDSPTLRHQSVPPTYPMGVYRCSDGWVGVTALTPAQWRALCELTEVPECGTDPRYFASIDRFILADELEAKLAPGIAEVVCQSPG